MRKGSTIIYSGSGWDLTVRELMFSIVIILVMLTGGFFISEKISSSCDNKNEEYYQAIKIDNDAEQFQYGMRTNVGNAFVKGTLSVYLPLLCPLISLFKYFRLARVKLSGNATDDIISDACNMFSL
jgi:hypothetical protein